MGAINMNVEEFIKKLNDTLTGLPAPIVVSKLFNVILILAQHVDPKVLDKVIEDLSIDEDVIGETEEWEEDLIEDDLEIEDEF